MFGSAGSGSCPPNQPSPPNPAHARDRDDREQALLIDRAFTIYRVPRGCWRSVDVDADGNATRQVAEVDFARGDWKARGLGVRVIAVRSLERQGRQLYLWDDSEWTVQAFLTNDMHGDADELATPLRRPCRCRAAHWRSQRRVGALARCLRLISRPTMPPCCSSCSRTTCCADTCSSRRRAGRVARALAPPRAARRGWALRPSRTDQDLAPNHDTHVVATSPRALRVRGRPIRRRRPVLRCDA